MSEDSPLWEARVVGYTDGCQGTPNKAYYEGPWGLSYLHGYKEGFCLRRAEQDERASSLLLTLAGWTPYDLAQSWVLKMVAPRYLAHSTRKG